MVNPTTLRSCVVPNCGNTTVSSPGKQFFTFSAQGERSQHWLLVCRREDLLEQVWENRKLAICSDHFLLEHFENIARTRLKENAVPTIFPPQHFSQDYQEVTDESDVVQEDFTQALKSEDTFLDPDPEQVSPEDEAFLQKLCRLCANASDDVVYLYSSVGQSLHLSKKINTSLPVTVQDTDPLPKQLCTTCVTKVNICYEFAEMCLVAEEKLTSLMKSHAFQSHCLVNSKAETIGEDQENFSSITVVESNRNLETKQEAPGKCNIEEDNADSEKDKKESSQCLLFSCPLCCEGTVSVKHASCDFQTVYISEKNIGLCSENSPETSSLGENYPTNDSRENEMPICNHTPQRSSSCDDVYEDDTLDTKDILWSKRHSVQTRSVNNCNKEAFDIVKSEICCQICQDIFESVGSCLKHSRLHFTDGSYPCAFCGKVFDSESSQLFHCRQHTISFKDSNYKGKRLKCDFCERRFNNQRTFFNHSCISSEPKQFKCKTCKKSYNTQERLLFHQKFHEGARLNYCEKCDKVFDHEGTLYYHTRMVHDGERPFSCNICSKKFYSNSRLIAHKRVHTGERPFECEMCNRRFYDKDTLKGHYVTHMPVKPFQCEHCGVCWGRKSMLNHHLRTVHSGESRVSRKVPSLIHYYCKICDHIYTNYSDVVVHRTTHWKTSAPGEGNVEASAQICEYCGESFSMVGALIKHRKQKHPQEKPYICSVCKETFPSLYEARSHRNVHLDAEEQKDDGVKKDKSTFVCESCGVVFTEKRTFMRHKREHRVNRNFQCIECKKLFADNQRLTVHMRLHTGEKPYTCSVCAKKFSQTSALYTHVLLHTGEKPHSCDFCGKAFRIKADRDNHRRTHTGEKPYKCEFCEKTFRTGQVYYQHRMIHTGERRFPCNVCGKAFKRSHTLVVHKRIHTGEKPNICDICGKGFRQRSDMRKHRALHSASAE